MRRKRWARVVRGPRTGHWPSSWTSCAGRSRLKTASTSEGVGRNPFPTQAAISVEGLVGSEGQPCDCQRLDGVSQPAHAPADSSYRAVSPGRGVPSRDGGAERLRGGPPRGHAPEDAAILRVMLSARDDQLDTPNRPDAQLYIKCDGPDFLALHRRLMAQVSRPTLSSKTRASAVPASAGAREVEQSANGGGEESRTVDAQLRDQPERIYELFASYAVEAGAVRDRQSRRVDRGCERRAGLRACDVRTVQDPGPRRRWRLTVGSPGSK